MDRRIQGFVVVVALAAAGVSAWADVFVESVRARCAAILLAASEPGGVEGSLAEAVEVADLASGWASGSQLAAVGWAEGTLSILRTAEKARFGSLGAVGRSPAFATELGLLIRDQNDAAGVMGLALRLAESREREVQRYPNLAAAVCVVHDRPWTRRINENTVRAPEALDAFDYFVRHARSLQHDPARMPSLLLVHVVSVTEPIEQLEWAMRQYGRHPSPGRRFFEIRYDNDAFRRGTEKRVTAAGNYRIESIKQHGGVCADQAYFAEMVGKATGIPSCYVSAAGAQVAHAWIGYLETRQRAGWDFDQGRYRDYQNLRGQIICPQSRERISDGHVGLLGGLMNAPADDIRASMGAALTARRMSASGDRDRGGRAFEAPDEVEGVQRRATLRQPRTGGIDDRLGLLRLALTRCAFVPEAWVVVASFGASGEMTSRQLDDWAQSLMRLCGTAHQDFSFDLLVALIGAEADVRSRQRMWDWAFSRYRARPDLASAVRFHQGRMWEGAGRRDHAWSAYEDIVKRFLNDGPMSVAALISMRDLLDRNERRDQFLPYLQDAARRVRAPSDAGDAFRVQSNHYRIHEMLIEELARHGRSRDADRVRAQLRLVD
ncbi:MAG: hypothetical protein EA378_10320 [Phycisphaerales bacterium]|nr:MAG: hypothetical protein EA378_10320 [Phycisphaerales bacterium]